MFIYREFVVLQMTGIELPTGFMTIEKDMKHVESDPIGTSFPSIWKYFIFPLFSRISIPTLKFPCLF
jgi:hypothetical protein